MEFFQRAAKTIEDHAGVFADPRFWAFFGSALIVSVAYMDPGNFGTDIQAGASFNYSLLWIVWLSGAMAMLLQYLSGKLGLAGYSLAELVSLKWKNKNGVLAYWILSEIAIIATDLAEFLGIAIALNLLFGIPLLDAAVLSCLDVFLLVLLTRDSFRPLEYAFVAFVSIIGLGYLYEIFITKPLLAPILLGSITPTLSGQTVIVVVGIIGATVMPHALFVHSWLTKNKMKDNQGKLDKKTANRFHLMDTLTSLLVASFINAAILIMAAAAFYVAGGSNVATINQAYQTLVPVFGGMAATIFAVTLLFSGISSSITGTLAGQSIMESLTDFKVPTWARRIFTRIVNIIPLAVAVYLKIDPLIILVYSQVALSFLIPLPMIPLILFTMDEKIMGDLKNSKIITILGILTAATIIVLNIYLLAQFAGVAPG
jgi:manganese transport protein